MLAWIRNWLSRGGAGAPRLAPSAEGLQGLLVERRRLDEIMASYREFGFHTLISECKRRRAEVERKIREIRQETVQRS